MKIGVISALDSEHKQLASRLTDNKDVYAKPFAYTVGRLGDNELILTQCGIGKVNAALGAQQLISRFDPDCILNTGVAGGIDDSLNVTDIVAGSRVAYHDVWCGDGNEWGQVQGLPLFFDCDSNLLRYAVELNSNGLDSKIVAGLICTGDQFISDKSQLEKIKNRYPDGLAVDMESAAMAQTCFMHDVPFLSFRIISDTPGATADNFSQYKNFWGTLAERSYQTTWKFLSGLPTKL